MRSQTRIGLLIGVGLVVIGLLTLSAQFVNLDLLRYVVPIAISGIGVVLLGAMVASGRPVRAGGTPEGGWYAVPGIMFIILGFVLLFQSATDYWASWAYIWALVAPTGTGLGVLVLAWWTRQPGLRYVGLGLVTAGCALLLILGSCFELFVAAMGYVTPGRFLWPLALVALGVLVLTWRRVAPLLRTHFSSRSIIEGRWVESRPEPEWRDELPPRHRSQD